MSAKLKLELDLSELYTETEEEGEYQLDELFKDAIKSEVKSEMRNIISLQVKGEIQRVSREELSNEIILEMKMFMRKFLTDYKLPDAYGDDQSPESFLLKKFKDEVVSGNKLANEVRDLAKKWGEELKRQYDVAYASKLVQTLNEQGLLLPNVAQLLLDKKAI